MNRNRLPILLLGSLLILAGCTAAPRYRSKSAEVAPSDFDGREVVREAKRYIGTPYKMGGTTTNGLDCSGLVSTVYGKFGIAVPRTSREQAGFGQKIGRSELKPGDLAIITAAHGCNPTWPGTDHTREAVPILAFGPEVKAGRLGRRQQAVSERMGGGRCLTCLWCCGTLVAATFRKLFSQI